jgi:hypothetical protein
MPEVPRHRLMVGGASLAGTCLAVGLWLAAPASAGTPHSSGSAAAVTVSGSATPTPSSGSFPDWVPAGSGPPPGPGGVPHWTPAGSGPPPSSGTGMASSS